MILKSFFGTYISDLKSIYVKRDDAYQRLECYLPCATGTLKEPINKTAERWLFEFESGLRVASKLGNTRFIIQNDKIIIDGVFNKIAP